MRCSQRRHRDPVALTVPTVTRALIRSAAQSHFLAEYEILAPKAAGDCPNFAQSAEQNGTVPLSERF
jgi:hypothetical protein